ncbi:MAG: tetratricopeptide repeat protein [Patescibacteria group bacterium]
MFYFILLALSFLGLLVIYFRRSKSYRLLLMDQALVPDDGIPIPHEEMTAERAEILSKTIPIHEHLEMKEIFKNGEISFLAGDYDESEKLFIRVLSIDEHHEESHARLGLIYLKKGLSTKAEAVYRKLLGLNPTHPSYHSNLALGLYMQRRMEDARDSYLKAIELDPDKANRYINLAHVYRDLKSHDLALEAVEKALQIAPQNQYRLIFSEILCDLGRLDEAREIIQKALQEEDKESELRPVARLLLKKIEKTES